MSLMPGFLPLVQTLQKGRKLFGQAIKHDIDTERIEVEREELELMILRLNLVHPCFHIFSLLASAVMKL